jgi:hypothetical protein
MVNQKFAFAIVGAFMITFSAHAGEQPQKARYVNLKPSELHCTKLGDVEGHVICSYQVPGVAVFPDGTLAARVTTGTLDYINGEGTAEGYTITTHPDGSTHTGKWSGISKVNDQKVRIIEGPYECVAGSGRFAGIKCEGKYLSTVQEGGFMIGEFEGKMTLPD